MSDNNLYRYICPTCGIAYGLDKDVDSVWRIKGHVYWCPNGHQLALEKSNVNELQELKRNLDTATTEAAAQKKRADDLQAELDIWKPRTKET